MNVILKLKIMEKYRYQFDLARELGITEDRLSRIVHNRVCPSDVEKRGIARRLRVKVNDIFPVEKS